MNKIWIPIFVLFVLSFDAINSFPINNLDTEKESKSTIEITTSLQKDVVGTETQTIILAGSICPKGRSLIGGVCRKEGRCLD
ncbi:CLUMA_CG017805, isoform A [Clunio marinus]|uniref:CLUMA_CG017805, isoform A n=1 Tax=Clunio marinus TaxID=568069 RepID=A0A1J1J1K7_9DIPT|nr:CLUMA_CG017805, isoform A [Clunio marinus]